MRWSLFSVVCLMMMSSLAEGAEGPSLWKPGDRWALSVESLAPTPKASQQPYRVNVTVAGLDTVGATQCWRLGFSPVLGTPPAFNYQYSVWVGRDSGWVHKVRRVQLPEYLDVDRFLDVLFLCAAPPGAPLEMLPPSPSRVVAVEEYPPLSITRSEMEGLIIMHARVIVNAKEELGVRQTWAVGEKWWREYEHYQDGKLTLRARRIEPFPPLPTNAHPKAQPSRPEEKRFALRFDARLQIRLTIEEENPDIETVLHRLEAATGLRLALDEKILAHRPKLGSLQLRQVPAWSVMEFLAERDMKNGRWVRHPDGYLLTGEPLVSQPPEKSTNYRAWLIASLAVLTLLAGALGLRWWRSQAKSTAASSDSSKAST